MINHFRLFYYFIIVIITSSTWLTTLVFFLKEKDKLTIHFLIFSGLNIIYFSIIFLTAYIQNSIHFPFTLQQVWAVSRLINRLRFFFFIYFIHALKGDTLSKYVNFTITIIMITGFFILPLLFPLVPRFLMGSVFIYTLFFTGKLYLVKQPKPVKCRPLLGDVFMLTIFLNVLMIIDIIENLPVMKLWSAVLTSDLYPPVLAVLSGIYAFHLIKKGFAKVYYQNTLKIPESILEEFDISAREKEIIKLILAGHSNTEIAERLFIANSTVKNISIKFSGRWISGPAGSF